ncbi:hypothetical protein PG996_012200 [Apiospora saccharicola]|uniref:Protein kinase domain-containing protein n=1 Tax=Apiospora saccharicola TaxID=335842 RepID=A0ABR1U1W8_9PEZI
MDMSDFPSLGSDVLDTKATDEIRKHFNSQQPRFAYEGVAGRGSYGMTYRVREKLPQGDGRQLAVKRALEGEEEELAGYEHIVRIVASHDGAKKQGGFARWARRLSSRGSKADVRESLVGLKGPVLMIEYLKNGDLAQLHYRTTKYDLVVPNRALWSILLCLVRACIAMAYPRNADENAEPRLEEIPGDGAKPSNLDHGDLHMGNGDIGSPSGNEHQLVPILKLIDFGQAKENEHAVQENLFKVSKIMINLIARKVVQVDKTVFDYKGYRTYATEILPPHPEDLDHDYKYASLDPRLRDLIARCLAQDPGERPGLAEMLRVVQAAAAGVDPDTEVAAAAATTITPGESENVRETDEAIRAFLKKALYDATEDMAGNREESVAPFGF